MKHERISPALRKSVNLSLDRTVVEDAKSLGINLSRVCDRALASQVKYEREARWKTENAEAIQSFNDYVDRSGIPLSQYRQF